ncbi:hypothetical protein [Pseudalkalibacillus sp. SCS-8]|uniref:hypothetical protein n=1 Tax=Pseudalkalibacillus nanhaiensis TaxID=3115291 RepID=UPI0032DB084E
MVSFQEEFMKSRGKPIVYKGKTIMMLDRIAIGKKSKIRIKFEKTNSEWDQGISLKVDKGIIVEGEEIKHLRLWEKHAPSYLEYDVETNNGELLLWNIWDTGNGSTDAWINGAAMIAQDLDNGKIYFCNDGHPDDNFDDLVFKIEIIE